MTLIGNGIYAVRAFVLPVGISADGDTVASPCWAVVQWRSSFEDLLYQVYVAGRFAGVTTDPSQRRLVVPVPDCSVAAIPIEVFGVTAENADINFSSELADGYPGPGRVQLKILRNQMLPAGGSLQIYFDHGSGQIDYNESLNDFPIPLWPSWQSKVGFGLSKFAYSDFGWDGSASVGLGCGCFGLGEFGFNANAIIWQSEPLHTGVYKFAVVITDAYGNSSEPILSEPVTITPAAKSSTGLNIASYDRLSDQLILEIIS